MEEGWRMMDERVGREIYEGGVVVEREMFSVGGGWGGLEEEWERRYKLSVFHGKAWIRGCRLALCAVVAGAKGKDDKHPHMP